MSTEPIPDAARNPARKRVCMIVYANFVTEGRARLEAEALISGGHEVLFLVPKDGPKPRTYVVDAILVKELNLRRYQGKSTARYLLSYSRFLVLAFLACSRLFLQHRASVVHIHNMPNSLVFAALLPRLLGGRVILDVHDTVLETYATKFGTNSRLLLGLLRLEERICCRLAHKIVCVNHVQREAIIQRCIPAEKIATIISMPRFAAVKSSSDGHNPNQPFRLVNHGTISRRLGIDLIVQAVARVVRKVPDFEFHLYGDGDDLSEVIRLAKSLQIMDHVHFHGVVPWNKLPEELAAMDAGIVANRRNVATELMLPAKLLDYVVLGIPAIVPKLPGIEYYFSPEMVSYFEPENLDSMTQAILRLCQDKARRDRQPLKAMAFRETHGWHNQQRALWGLYEELR